MLQKAPKNIKRAPYALELKNENSQYTCLNHCFGCKLTLHPGWYSKQKGPQKTKAYITPWACTGYFTDFIFARKLHVSKKSGSNFIKLFPIEDCLLISEQSLQLETFSIKVLKCTGSLGPPYNFIIHKRNQLHKATSVEGQERKNSEFLTHLLQYY